MSSYGLDVLAFGPHPDDVELFCGGTLIHLADLGYTTGVVDLSHGERASNGTVAQRAKESEEASKLLGLSLRENLGLPDAFINPWSGDGQNLEGSQLGKVIDALRRYRPELVLIPWIEERHPDHVAAAELVTKAVFHAGLRNVQTASVAERFVPRQVLYYQLRHRMTPSFVVDTSNAQIRKLEAIHCYSSQLSRSAGAERTLISSSGAVAAIDARDRYCGSLIGAAHGEALRTPNVPGLIDPVKQFRDNPFTQAHAFEPLK